MSIIIILTYPLGFYLMFFYKISEEGLNLPFGNLIIFISGFPLNFVTFFPVGTLFLLLWLTYLLLGIVALKFKVSGKRPFLITASTFSILYLINDLLEFLQRRLGIEIGSLKTTDPARDFTSYTLSSITEEIGFRITLIGFTALILLAGKVNFSELLKTLWLPKRASSEVKYLYFVAIFSGFIFGLAHIYGGWKVGKFAEATLFGIVSGFLYINYGFTTPFLLHWAFNYSSTSFFFLPSIYFTIFSYLTYSLGLVNLIILIVKFIQKN